MTQFILAAQSQGGGSISFIIMMVAIFAIMYFFMIKPQQKRQKESQNFQNSLQEGTQVLTGGGIYGTVKKIDLASGIIEVKIADGVVIKVDKSYVFKTITTNNIYAYEMDHFTEMVRTGKSPLTREQLLNPIKLLNGIKKSLETGAAVAL